MQNQRTLTAFILKKQAFDEADEIITFFSKEQGKVRGLAKSVKLAKSKLQSKLQSLFLVNVSLSGKSALPKVTSVETIEVYSNLQSNLETIKLAIYGSELLLKFTGDEEVNEPLFLAFKSFLDHLNVSDPQLLENQLVKFKLEVLDACGLSIRSKLDPNIKSAKELNQILSEFIEYQLERKIKSEKFLDASVI